MGVRVSSSPRGCVPAQKERNRKKIGQISKMVLRYALMVELVDTTVLRAVAYASEFESRWGYKLIRRYLN